MDKDSQFYNNNQPQGTNQPIQDPSQDAKRRQKEYNKVLWDKTNLFPDNFDYSIDGDRISPLQALQLGLKSPVTWNMQQLVDASLPFEEWIKKNPTKTRWHYDRLQKQLRKHEHNWLYKALGWFLPHPTINPINNFRKNR